MMFYLNRDVMMKVAVNFVLVKHSLASRVGCLMRPTKLQRRVVFRPYGIMSHVLSHICVLFTSNNTPVLAELHRQVEQVSVISIDFQLHDNNVCQYETGHSDPLIVTTIARCEGKQKEAP